MLRGYLDDTLLSEYSQQKKKTNTSQSLQSLCRCEKSLQILVIGIALIAIWYHYIYLKVLKIRHPVELLIIIVQIIP